MPRTVISVGEDPELLSLRHAILEGAGYKVLTASDPHTAAEKIAVADCDVLLMCYSLRLDTRQQLAKQFRERCPDGRIIAITNQQQSRPPVDADTFIYGLEGPEMLLETVRTQLENRNQ